MPVDCATPPVGHHQQVSFVRVPFQLVSLMSGEVLLKTLCDNGSFFVVVGGGSILHKGDHVAVPVVFPFQKGHMVVSLDHVGIT